MSKKEGKKAVGKDLSNPTGELEATQSVDVTQELEQSPLEESLDSLLQLLRGDLLDIKEQVRLAQRLDPLLVDIPQMLADKDHVFVINFIKVLWRRNVWTTDVGALIYAPDDGVSEAAKEYVQKMARQNPADIELIIASAIEIKKAQPEKATDSMKARVEALLEDMRYQLMALLVTYIAKEAPLSLQHLYNELYAHADDKLLQHLLFDGSMAIRRATLRMLAARQEVALGILSSALVLLKDVDATVARNVLLMLQKHRSFPELTIPQVFSYCMHANDEDVALGIDVIKRFEADGIETVKTLFTDVRGNATRVLSQLVLSHPQRWLPLLLELEESFNTPEHVILRVEYILKQIAQILPEKHDEIMDAIEEREYRRNPKDPELPKEDRSAMVEAPFGMPVEGFDTRILEEKELKAVKSIEPEHLIYLLTHGIDVIRHNAVNLSRLLKVKDPRAHEYIKVMLRTHDPQVSLDIQNTLVKISEHAYYVPVFLRELGLSGLQEVQRNLLEHLDTAASVSTILALFEEKPKESYKVIRQLFDAKNGKRLLPHFLKYANVGVDDAVAEYALRLLLETKIYDESIRKQLIALIKEKSFYHESIKRRRALTLLKHMEHDEETIDFLLEYIKTVTNSGIKTQILAIFNRFEVEYFEDDDEDEYTDDW